MTTDLVDAVILAGGEGRRLRSAVPDLPKPLAPVLGRPFLEHQLNWLAAQPGVRKAVLALGYMSDAVIDHFERFPAKVPLEFVVEKELLGTGGGLRNAAKAADSEFLLGLNGDSLLKWRLPDLRAAHEQSGATVTMALANVEDVARYGAVSCDEAGVIRKFSEKDEKQGAGLINAGVYLIERAALMTKPEGVAFSAERDWFPELCAGGRLAGCVFESPFIDIGLPETYAAAGDFISALDR